MNYCNNLSEIDRMNLAEEWNQIYKMIANEEYMELKARHCEEKRKGNEKGMTRSLQAPRLTHTMGLEGL